MVAAAPPRTLTVSFDAKIVRALASFDQQADAKVSQTVKEAIEFYLDQPLYRSAERLAARFQAGVTITRFNAIGEASYVIGGPYARDVDEAGDGFGPERAASESEEAARVSVSLAPEIRDRLEERAEQEDIGLADLVRSATTLYLAEVISHLPSPSSTSAGESGGHGSGSRDGGGPSGTHDSARDDNPTGPLPRMSFASD